MASPNTDSLSAIYDTISARVIAFTPKVGNGVGAPLSALLGDRLYNEDPPDDAVFPYGVQTLTLVDTGDDAHLRLAGLYELMLYARPSVARRQLRDAGDVAVQALLEWATTSGGLIVFTGASSRGLPRFSGPADSELSAVRVISSLYVWPDFLTQYANRSG